MTDLDLTLVYLVKGEEILLAMKKRGFGEGMWNGIGGKVDKDESVESAMLRECQEEIEVSPKDYQKMGYLIFDEHHDNIRKLMHIHIYVCTKWQGEPTETEEMRPEWFSYQSMPYDLMWPADRLWLPTVLEGNKITGEFRLRADNSVEKYNFEKVETLPDK